MISRYPFFSYGAKNPPRPPYISVSFHGGLVVPQSFLDIYSQNGRHEFFCPLGGGTFRGIYLERVGMGSPVRWPSIAWLSLSRLRVQQAQARVIFHAQRYL